MINKKLLKIYPVIIIGVIIIIIFSIVLYFYYKTPTKFNVTPTNFTSDIPEVSVFAENLSDDIVPFSTEELSYLDGLSEEPMVKHVRVSINKYLDTGADDNGSVNEMKNCGYEKFGDYIVEKFVPFQVDHNSYGGANIKLIFIDKPDKIFTAWVYDLAGGGFELRSFCDEKKPKEAMGVLNKAFSVLFEDESKSV